jgi:hypothetical protein
MKAGLLTKPIVKGCISGTWRIMVVIPLAKQISIMLCAIFGVYHCINLNTKLQTCNPFSLISAVFLNFEQINNSWKSLRPYKMKIPKRYWTSLISIF